MYEICKRYAQDMPEMCLYIIYHFLKMEFDSGVRPSCLQKVYDECGRCAPTLGCSGELRRESRIDSKNS